MSKFKKVFKAVKKVVRSPLGRIGIPLALSFTPIGPALGSALGATTAAGQAALGGGLLGAGASALSGGGLKGALLGGATGAAGGYVTGGGNVPGLGSIGKNVPLSGYGPSQAAPSGVLGSISKGLSNIGSVSGAGAGGGNSMFSLSNVLSGVNSYGAQEDMEDDLLEQQRKAAGALAPYQNAGLTAQQQLSKALSAGFDPTKVGDDPGYQFNLAQGQKALDRSAAARGGFYSGQALKDATDYGQSLANNYVNDYYNRWQGTNTQLGGVAGRGLNAAGALTDVYDNMGNIKANATLGMNNTLTGMLSGAGARQIVGYRQDGTPIYADDKTLSAYGA